MSAILKFDFQKRKQLRFSEVNKLHKKDPILHVATSFSLKQGETRTSHGPIPHPLKYLLSFKPMKLLNKMTCFCEPKLLQKRQLSQLQICYLFSINRNMTW